MASRTRTTSPASTSCAVGDGDPDDRAGHRRQQAAARHRVGRVGEARDLAQRRRDPPGRRRRPRGAGDARRSIRPSVRSAVDLEQRRGRRRPRARSTPSTTKPSRVPHHSTGDSSPRRSAVRCGWLTTLRQADGDALLDRTRAPRRRAASASAAGHGDRRSGRRRRSPSAAVSSQDVVDRRRRGTPGRRRIATSRSRLVVTPWIRARRRARGELAGRLVAGRRLGDHLGQHRVVVGADLVAGLEAGVDADAALAAARTPRRGDLEGDQPPALRLVVGAGSSA